MRNILSPLRNIVYLIAFEQSDGLRFLIHSEFKGHKRF